MLLSGCSSALGFIFQTSQVARGSVGCNCFRHSSLFQSHFTYLFSVSPDGRRRKERKHQDTRSLVSGLMLLIPKDLKLA